MNNPVASMLVVSRKVENALVKTFRCVQRGGLPPPTQPAHPAPHHPPCCSTIVKSYFPKLSAHIEALGAPARNVIASWFRGFFVGWLPQADVHRVVDAYLLEGPKVLLRYGLAMLKLNKRRLKSTASAAEFDRVLRRWVARTVTGYAAHDGEDYPHIYSFELLQGTAFAGIQRLSRESISSLMLKYMAKVRGATAGGETARETPRDGELATAAAAPSARAAAVSGAALPPGRSTLIALLPYDDGADDETAPAVWYSAKIVGIGSRLMSDDFTTVDDTLLRGRVLGSRADLRRCLYDPPRLIDGVFPPMDDDAPGGSSHGTSSAAAGSMGWLEGLYAVKHHHHAGRHPPAAAAAGASGAPASSSAVAVPESVTGAAYSVSSSPYLASLSTFMPDTVSHYNWACVYSTDLHGRSLATLLRRTNGFSPVFVLLQAEVRAPRLPQASSDGTAVAAAPGAGYASKLRTALSSKRPVFGFFSSQGLSPTGPAAGSSGAGGGPAPATGRAQWVGSHQDFMFQLFPELNCFSVSSVLAPYAGGGGGGGAGDSDKPAYVQSTSGADVHGAGHQTSLPCSHFLACSGDTVLVGGHPGKPGAASLRLGSGLETALVSKALLLDMAVPEAAMPDGSGGGAAGAATARDTDVVLDLLSLEAFAFMDRRGNFLAVGGGRGGAAGAAVAAAAESREAYKHTLEAYWSASSGGGGAAAPSVAPRSGAAQGGAAAGGGGGGRPVGAVAAAAPGVSAASTATGGGSGGGRGSATLAAPGAPAPERPPAPPLKRATSQTILEM